MRRQRPSRTAIKIARFTMLLGSIPRLRSVLPEGTAETGEAILRSSGVVAARHMDAMKRESTHRLYALVERWLGRGQVLWFGVRKRWMAEKVERGIADGARQLLVIGAGFDPLATRIARRHPEVLCVEVDAPATATPKRTAVERAGLAAPNLVISAADLASQPLDEVLKATPWRTDVRSVVVAEGLLMYLAPSDVAQLLGRVRRSVPPGSRLAFSAVGRDDRGRPRLMLDAGCLNRTIQALLRLAGERMRWGIEPSEVPALLETSGYRVLEHPTDDSLRKQLLEPHGLGTEPLAAYEHLTLAEVVERG